MFSKLSGRTKTQEIEKPQSFASQLAEATKLFTDAVSKLKNISSGVSKKRKKTMQKSKACLWKISLFKNLKTKRTNKRNSLTD